MTSTSMYDGRVHLGTVRECGPGSFEAVTPEGQSRGLFPTRKAAIAALPSERAALIEEARVLFGDRAADELREAKR